MNSNILFLGIDSLRADHCYDHKKSYSTPNFDQLIKKGIFFNESIGFFCATRPIKISAIIIGMPINKTQIR